MIQEQYRDATLILIGHGTTQNESSSATVMEHVAGLRQLGCFKEVHAAFWKQDPQVQVVLQQAKTPRVFLVPFFISEGYFSDVVIPKALGFLTESGALSRQLQLGSQSLYYTKPVGSHPSMTQVILERAQNVLKQFPFPRCPKEAETTLFIAGHGTEQNTKSREAIDLQVERISQLGIFSAVHAVFLEESPKIPECYQLSTTHNLVVVPFFASDGLHVAEDIPVLLGEAAAVVRRRLEGGRPTWRNPTEKHGKFVWYTHSVGAAPLMKEVILELVNDVVAEVG